MKKNKINKIILFLLVVTESFLLSAGPVLALSIPSPSSVLRTIESRYHLNRESLRNQGEYFNVSDSKKEAPQVMLTFNPSDPKPGEKITAHATPMFFSTAPENLYFTWYLRKVYNIEDKKFTCRKDTKDEETIEFCDRDGNGKVDENDWKIEAMRNITNAGFDAAKADYSLDKDGNRDGYEAIWGGENRDKRWKHFNKDYYLTNSSGGYIYEPASGNYAHCYLHDFQSGENYELVESQNYTFSCPAGQQVFCVEDNDLNCVEGADINTYTVCEDSLETPTCSNVSGGTGYATCSSGHPVCASSISSFNCSSVTGATDHACQTLFPAYVNAGTNIACTASNTNGGRNLCRHLFPMYKNFRGSINMGEDDSGNMVSVRADLKDEKLGDGRFRLDEEIFWKTNPADPNTADNGKKDEANAVGLGIGSFTWNYSPGDMVGVAVEGTSMVPTKHDDSTMMVMWALPKNVCNISSTSHYVKRIKGYDVKIPTTNKNINDCLEDNLVDPKEEGHPSRINVELSYSPENPNNDPTPLDRGNSGDVLFVSTTTDNSEQGSVHSEYEWNVYLSSNGSPDPAVTSDGRWMNITKSLLDNNLISGPVKGNGLDELNIKMALSEEILPSGAELDDVFPSGIGYLNIRTAVREYFDSEVVREGKGDVIVKVMSSGEKLAAYAAEADPVTGKVFISGASSPVCQNCTGKKTPLCYVVKNDIIGVRFDSPDFTPGRDNYSWTINGHPLNCNARVSDNCSDEKQTNVNFFPVTGEPGTTYDVSLTAVKSLSEDGSKSGKTIALNRTFQVVEPFVKIEPGDDSVWKKHLGVYLDLDNNAFEHLSDSIFETFAETPPTLTAAFHPSWLINNISEEQIKFSIDGQTVPASKTNIFLETDEECPGTYIPAYSASAPSAKEAGAVYNASVEAAFYIPNENRKALKNIWGVSQLETGEFLMSDSAQIEVSTMDPNAPATTFKKPLSFIAGLASYIPNEFSFLLRIILTLFVIIAVTGIVFSFFPENAPGKILKD